MASILYSVYAVVVLLVAAVGLLWIGFSVPGPESEQRWYRALTVLGAAFVVLMVGLFMV